MESGGREIERLAGMESIQESQWVQVRGAKGRRLNLLLFCCFWDGNGLDGCEEKRLVRKDARETEARKEF